MTTNMPGFTAESALSPGGRSYPLTRLSEGEPGAAVPEVRAALINNGGGGSGSNFTCDESAGTCSCLGGSLSDDCWVIGQYCTTGLQCSPYFPYKCTCSYLSAVTTRPIFTRPGLGGVFTR